MDYSTKLHSSIFHPTLRKWQSANTAITADHLMYPVFIIENDDAIQEIPSLPGIKRFGINPLKAHLEELVTKGLSSILIFGVVETLPKDSNGISADSAQNPVIRALPKLSKWFPNLVLACDVCLCTYTDHGHCGLLNGTAIDNDASIKRIAEIAYAYGKNGAHIVAPSDMMDNRIGSIKEILHKNGLDNKVAVLSYAAKFASTFYGPFRDAANSAPGFGDRKCYQLPPNSKGLAARAAQRDADEGADMLMVKPGLAYLDIVKQTKDQHPNLPLFIYQVSGEYAMLYHGAKNGAFKLEQALMEVLESMRRAGGDIIITYYTPLVLDIIRANNN